MSSTSCGDDPVGFLQRDMGFFSPGDASGPLLGQQPTPHDRQGRSDQSIPRNANFQFILSPSQPNLGLLHSLDLGSFSRQFRRHLDSSPYQISCCGFHNWVRSSPFALPCRSFGSGLEQHWRVLSWVPAEISMIFIISRYLCTTPPHAATGESMRTLSIDFLIHQGAIAPPRHRIRSALPRPNCQWAGGDTPPDQVCARFVSVFRCVESHHSGTCSRVATNRGSKPAGSVWPGPRVWPQIALEREA